MLIPSVKVWNNEENKSNYPGGHQSSYTRDDPFHQGHDASSWQRACALAAEFGDANHGRKEQWPQPAAPR